MERMTNKNVRSKIQKLWEKSWRICEMARIRMFNCLRANRRTSAIGSGTGTSSRWLVCNTRPVGKEYGTWDRARNKSKSTYIKIKRERDWLDRSCSRGTEWNQQEQNNDWSELRRKLGVLPSEHQSSSSVAASTSCSLLSSSFSSLYSTSWYPSSSFFFSWCGAWPHQVIKPARVLHSTHREKWSKSRNKNLLVPVALLSFFQ